MRDLMVSCAREEEFSSVFIQSRPDSLISLRAYSIEFEMSGFVTCAEGFFRWCGGKSSSMVKNDGGSGSLSNGLSDGGGTTTSSSVNWRASNSVSFNMILRVVT